MNYCHKLLFSNIFTTLFSRPFKFQSINAGRSGSASLKSDCRDLRIRKFMFAQKLNFFQRKRLNCEWLRLVLICTMHSSVNWSQSWDIKSKSISAVSSILRKEWLVFIRPIKAVCIINLFSYWVYMKNMGNFYSIEFRRFWMLTNNIFSKVYSIQLIQTNSLKRMRWVNHLFNKYNYLLALV